MNFLLHRHLAAEELGVVAGVGAMLPDLWRMADRRLRARPGRGEGALGLEAELSAGVEHHLAEDASFHRDPLFVEGERQLATAFRDARLTARRMGLLAHVAWELCLDGALLQMYGLDSALGGLRRGLELLEAENGEPLARLARRHATRDLATHPDSPLHRRLEHLLDELLASDWIPGYQHPEGIADRLLGVRRRLGLEPLDPAQYQRLVLTLAPALDRARQRLSPWLADRVPFDRPA